MNNTVEQKKHQKNSRPAKTKLIVNSVLISIVTCVGLFLTLSVPNTLNTSLHQLLSHSDQRQLRVMSEEIHIKFRLQDSIKTDMVTNEPVITCTSLFHAYIV